MKRIALLISLMACEAGHQHAPGELQQINAANALTQSYAQSALARWDVRGHAAGSDCLVLFVETSIFMEDSMVEALHYGAGAYDIYRGGVRQFASDRHFRGVAYKDGSGRQWTYGEVNASEVLTPCR